MMARLFRVLVLLVPAAMVWMMSGEAARGQTTLPSKIDVPWSSTQENLHIIHTWHQPGTDRVLRLAFSTPFQDDTGPGARTYMTWYQVSTDGGKTYDQLKQVIQQGAEYNAMHPAWPIWSGKNMYVPSVPPPSLASNGEIMVPIYLWPLGKDGKRLHDDRFTYTDDGVLIGTWNADKTDLTWDLGETVRLDGETQSTRGAMEPAIIELDQPGHFLMIMRASNYKKPDMPSYKWKSESTDYCRTWSKPTPLTYSDGENFFSPSACSDIRRNSKTHKIYWIGNICPQNADGNYPRFPLVIAELDQKSLGLIKSTLRVIADRDPGKDSPYVQFSNFHVSEDAKTGDFIVTLQRLDYEPGKDYRGHKWPRMRLVVPPEPAAAE
jgi:hypothetical protein